MDPSSPAGSAGRRSAVPDADPTVAQPFDGYGADTTGGTTSVLARPDEATSVVPAYPDEAAGDPPGPVDGDTALVTSDHEPPSSGLRGARRVGVGILIGAFLMFAVASLDSLLGAQVPVLGSFASSGVPPKAEEPPPLPPPPDTPGTCLNWSRADATDTSAVPCTQSHLFEQVGRVQLPDQPVFPPDAAWQKLVADRCTPIATTYLKGKLDPDGKFRVGALKPSEARWNEGDRGMRCGLQRSSRSGAMLPITGKVADQDQSDVQPPGTCLALDGRGVGDPTDCAGPHAVEAVGVIDLGTEFEKDWPKVDDQDAHLQDACTTAANKFAGNDKVIGDKKLTVYWNNLSEGSWKAGSRKVNCNIGTLLPDGSGFAALTGSIKGNLAVAGQPAQPGQPGQPAQPGATTPGAPATPGTAPTQGAPDTPAGPTGSADPSTPAGSAVPGPGTPPALPTGPPPGMTTPELAPPPGIPGLDGN